MKYTRSALLPDIIIIELTIFKDSRGHFFEGFQTERYKEIGIKEQFVQDNFSRSIQNTLRGLHYQLQSPQGKLVGVTAGRVLDVIVDIRKGSSTFGQSIQIELSDENAKQIYIPKGFAHGFFVLSDTADFYYKCTEFYAPHDEHGIAWNDTNLNIAWPTNITPLLSEKDQAYLPLNKISPENLPKYVTL